MTAETRFESHINSKIFTKNPIVELGINIRVVLEGFEHTVDKVHKCEIIFKDVIAYKEEDSMFSLYPDEAYESVAEIMDSDWIKSFAKINPQKLCYWNPKHYALYLEDYGFIQVLARSFTARELPLDSE